MTLSATRVAAFRFRQRFLRFLESEVADIVASRGQVAAELTYLAGIPSSIV